MDTGIRLNKYIAQSGVCSRRKADELIVAGEVAVNDRIVTELGFRVQPSDDVWCSGQQVVLEQPVYVLLNKPEGAISSASDEKHRITVCDLVRKAASERLYPVGRLDAMTTGVLVMTNDGELSQKLTHPSNKISKTYEVKLSKIVKDNDIRRIIKGVRLSDGVVKVDSVSHVKNKHKSFVQVVLHSGKNRVVRRLFEELGYEVRSLDRVALAHLTYRGVSRGAWRYLSHKEVATLKGN
jgi:23S rRNA pseudouridine2605 synthase